jgi:HD-GYP domain-containing protein (c-di-GMP phosphodiesterase class II)
MSDGIKIRIPWWERMLQEPTVMLDNLVLSLSDSLDLIHPCAVDHQQRVAYIALRIAKAMGHHPATQADLMYASVLHDIGLLSVEEKIQSMTMDSKDEGRHAGVGADLLRRFSSFSKASQIVRIHHRSWSDKPGQSETDDIIRILANMLSLGDHVDRAVNRGTGILGQAKAVVEGVSQLAEKEFSLEIVQCFRELAAEESFWLDFASPRIYSVLSGMVQWPRVELDLHAMEEIAQIFCRIVDFRSRFTSTHTAGVAAVARELARRMCFSGKGCQQMLVAGYLHDLGKVAVPNAILDKPGKLDPEEFDVIRAHTYHTYHILSTIGGFEEIAIWAAFHHERLDGKGYPFHVRGEDIPLGSRIMCVADVFTAGTENRPYRKGTGRNETLPILQNMARSGSLDDNVVRVLTENYDEIDRMRSDVQEISASEYSDFVSQKTGAGRSLSRI